MAGSSSFSLTRRRLLKGSSSLLAFTMLPSCSSVVPWDIETQGIDVHCHAFNASDLSVRGFVQRVALGDHEDQIELPPAVAQQEAFFQGLAALLVKVLSTNTVTAEKEIAWIIAGKSDEEGTALLERQQGDLEKIIREFTVPAPPPLPGTPRNEINTHEFLPSYSPLIDQIKKELAEEKVGGPRKELGSPEALAEGLLLSRGTIGRAVRWALTLLGSRRSIIAKYQKLYGQKNGISLFTPALVDFEFWLNEKPRSPLLDQIKVMDLIQRQQTTGAAMHCFAPFDPWRQIMDEQEGNPNTALELVKHAVLEHGFVGVKLYPPMGFKPTGNNDTTAAYPARVKEIVKDYGKFSFLLDRALNKLYAWCEANDVPVMAHATNSNGAADGYARRANPANWAPVLKTFPKLRLNLAHFGGFDEVFKVQSANASWEWAIGSLLQNGFKGAYADISYLSEFMGDQTKPEDRRKIEKLLSNYIQTFDPAAEHLLYGSDWIMMGKEKDHETYPKIMEDLVKRIGLNAKQRQNLFRDNAIRFLGLEPGRKNRQRLEAYYKRYGLDPERLRRIVG